MSHQKCHFEWDTEFYRADILADYLRVYEIIYVKTDILYFIFSMFNSIHVKRIILGAKIILIKFKLKKYRGHISVMIVAIAQVLEFTKFFC